MGHTATIRFTAPVDPRTVWATAQRVISAPHDYAWDRHPPGTQTSTADGWWLAHPQQGADAIASMDYGAEGSMLDDSEYRDYPDDYTPDQIPPAGYVELRLNTSYAYERANIARAIELARIVGIPAAMRNDYTGAWSDLPAVTTE